MPIPLDIANLASSHMVEDDGDIGPLDLANLNSSSIHGDLPQLVEEPVLPGVSQVNQQGAIKIDFYLIIPFSCYRLMKSTTTRMSTV